jgi:hypothetical protein
MIIAFVHHTAISEDTGEVKQTIFQRWWLRRNELETSSGTAALK